MSKKIPNKIRESRDKPETGSFVVDQAFNQACNAKANLSLYKFVYRSRISFAVVLVLLSSFLIQGIERAEANSDDLSVAAVEVNVSEVLDLVGDEVVTEKVVEEDSSGDDEVEIVDLDEEEDNGAEIDLSENQDEIDSGDADVSDSEDVNSDTDTLEDASDESLDSRDFLDDSEDENLDGIEDDGEDDIIVNPELASSSVELGDTVVVVESDSSFTFNKDECTVLATGSFYCAKPTERGLKDDLFAAPDTDGDLEIYFTKDGVETQVTKNLVDDAAPFYDKNSDTIVWHRLINDRYQIVSYDVESGKETIITNTKENNMEPNRQGKYTVWQRWVGGGWNIILYDGMTEKQLTKTTSHNVAPYIHGTLVVWNQYDQVNEGTIEMYDIATETFVTIEDPEGLSVSNPRMVFVYDSLHPNGDIVTKGYDVFAKKFIDLDTLPRDLPEELPKSDGTGETRALIQNKPNGKSEIEEVIDGSDLTTGSTTPSVVDAQEASSTPSISDEIVSEMLDVAVLSDSISEIEFTLDLSDGVVIEETNLVTEEPVDLNLAESEDVVVVSPEIIEFVESN